jgi:NAD(P)-dependent dehydrogenase (short-subunit alcohol dehydrogenase family)
MTESHFHPAIAPGNIAVITGAASGIGLAAAKRFADLGLRLGLADRDAAALAKTVAALPAGTQAFTQVTDVAERASVEAFARAIADRFGVVSVLMNNAGTGAGGGVLAAAGVWEQVMGVNLFGVLYGVQAFAPGMLAGDRPGLIINTGSKQGITQPPGNTAYNVSKSGVKALTEGLAHTLRGETGGRVSAHLLIPGFTFTGMTSGHHTALPPGAWTPEQVVERMLEGLARGEFYILCQDNETTRAMDEKRILWAAGDIVENRPALSRWHPDYQEAFQRYMKGD